MVQLLKKPVLDIINRSIAIEYQAYFVYRQAAHWFDSKNLPGTSSFCIRQAEDEHIHAKRLEEYVMKRGNLITLETPEINQKLVTETWNTNLEVFTYLHQKEIENYLLYESNAQVAKAENDDVSYKLFVEFMESQIQELSEFDVLMSKVKAYSAIPGLFYHLDHELRK
eukprot:403359342